ncbi:MAG: hypothetical protein JNG89_13715, partial [Planctomycetaceae bacterium]|nr:hypothetical protein [Planctomycetaceae bacterium]
MLRRRICVWATIAAVIANDLPLQLVQAGDWPWDRRHGPETAVTELAEQIDELEQHIDRYGTIVAKAPDVWGQARLTKYRRDYETQMLAELKEFKVRLNGAISRSDQAFLASAMSMQAAVSGRSAFTRIPNSTSETETLQRIDPPAALDPTKLVGDPNAGIIARNSVRTTTLGNFGVDAPNIGLEPTIELDQLSRYLNHLNELRRINDGDDSADAPGYAMHLVRLPISVLPGEETREGYGAEVTVMARPNLHDDLLPQTFRQLVINDLVDQLAFPLAKFLDSDKKKKAFDALEKYYLLNRAMQLREEYCNRRPGATEATHLLEEWTRLHKRAVEIQNAGDTNFRVPPPGDCVSPTSALEGSERAMASSATEQETATIRQVGSFIVPYAEIQEKVAEDVNNAVRDVFEVDVPIPEVSIAPSRKKSLPFPPSHLIEVYGAINFLLVAKLCDALKGDEPNQKATLLLDLQKVLSEEVHAACEYLDVHGHSWENCNDGLARVVREDNERQLAVLRDSFLGSTEPQIHKLTHTG